MTPPCTQEYAPYFAHYIQLALQHGDLIHTLKSQMGEVQLVFSSLSDEMAHFRYADNKWSLKEVLGHLTDTEQIFAYRALRIARGDQTSLPGFEENLFVASARFNEFSMARLLARFMHTRRASLDLLTALNPDEAAQTGLSNGHPTSVRAIAYMMAGHVEHHLELVRVRYLNISSSSINIQTSAA
ncbi:MAG TPA: DinB family protein [Rhodothermales bacterium]|nr:DinB family protein [Rhodothermales bacterium]HRR07368.1 DinB family protein [Rhodothermales bacterium]